MQQFHIAGVHILDGSLIVHILNALMKFLDKVLLFDDHSAIHHVVDGLGHSCICIEVRLEDGLKELVGSSIFNLLTYRHQVVILLNNSSISNGLL